MASVALLKLPPDEDHARAKAGYQLLLLLLRMAALLARTLSWFSSFMPWQWHCPHQRHTHTLQAVGWHQMEPRRSLLGFSPVLRFGSAKLLVPMIIGCPPLERGAFRSMWVKARLPEHALPAVAEARREFFFFYTARSARRRWTVPRESAVRVALSNGHAPSCCTPEMINCAPRSRVCLQFPVAFRQRAHGSCFSDQLEDASNKIHAKTLRMEPLLYLKYLQVSAIIATSIQHPSICFSPFSKHANGMEPPVMPMSRWSQACYPCRAYR